MSRKSKVSVGIGIPVLLLAGSALTGAWSPPDLVETVHLREEIRLHQSRAVSAASLPGTSGYTGQSSSAPVAGAPGPSAEETGVIAQVKSLFRSWVEKKPDPAQDQKVKAEMQVASTLRVEDGPAQESIGASIASAPQAPGSYSATEAPEETQVSHTGPGRAPAAASSGSEKQPSDASHSSLNSYGTRAQKPESAQVANTHTTVTAAQAKSPAAIQNPGLIREPSQPLVLIQPMPEPYRHREQLARKKTVVAPPPGFMGRIQTAFKKLLRSEPAPMPKVPVKSAEEIIANTSQGGFKELPSSLNETDRKIAAYDPEAAELKAQRAVETAEMKRRKKLEVLLSQVNLENHEVRLISQLRKRFPKEGERFEYYVRIRLGEDELEDAGFDSLQEAYVDEFNQNMGGAVAILKAALKSTLGDVDFTRFRAALFTLSNELGTRDREIAKHAWAELQALKAAGEPQDVKATVAAYSAYARSVSPTDKQSQRMLSDYVKDLKERDSVAGGVLQKRRSLAGSR